MEKYSDERLIFRLDISPTLKIHIFGNFLTHSDPLELIYNWFSEQLSMFDRKRDPGLAGGGGGGEGRRSIKAQRKKLKNKKRI